LVNSLKSTSFTKCENLSSQVRALKTILVLPVTNYGSLIEYKEKYSRSDMLGPLMKSSFQSEVFSSFLRAGLLVLSTYFRDIAAYSRAEIYLIPALMYFHLRDLN